MYPTTPFYLNTIRFIVSVTQFTRERIPHNPIKTCMFKIVFFNNTLRGVNDSSLGIKRDGV